MEAVRAVGGRQGGRKAKTGPEPAWFRGACAYDNPLFFSRLYGSQAAVPGPLDAFLTFRGRTAIRERLRPPEGPAEGCSEDPAGDGENPVKYFLQKNVKGPHHPQRARAQRCDACRRRTRWAPPRSGTAGRPPARREPTDGSGSRAASAQHPRPAGADDPRCRPRQHDRVLAGVNSPWWNPASRRERRGARLTRREEGAYWAYVTDEQRRQARCIAARMQRGPPPRAVKEDVD